MWVRPDGKRAYAAIGESAGVMTWDRDTATGGLTPLKREAGCTAMRSFGVRYYHACAPTRHLAGAWFAIGSPDGRHLYAGSLWDRELISFAIVRTTFSSDPVDFFVQEVGETAAAKTVTVRNEGTDPMPNAAVAIGGADASSYAIASNTCSGTLAVGAACTVGVTFTPTQEGLPQRDARHRLHGQRDEPGLGGAERHRHHHAAAASGARRSCPATRAA